VSLALGSVLAALQLLCGRRAKGLDPCLFGAGLALALNIGLAPVALTTELGGWLSDATLLGFPLGCARLAVLGLRFARPPASELGEPPRGAEGRERL
jgi:hypothetical protein